MIEPGRSYRVEMQLAKTGRGRNPSLPFAKTPLSEWKTLVTSSGWVQAAFGMLLCFAGFTIVALVVGSLCGRI